MKKCQHPAEHKFGEHKISSTIGNNMKAPAPFGAPFLRRALLCLLLALASSALAAPPGILWTGPPVTITHASPGELQDQITAGVRITRSTSGGGLYNSVTESGAVYGTSPADTEWAIGALANATNLIYGPCPLEAAHNPPHYANPPTTFVVHLKNEGIYLSLTLTAWGGSFGIGDKSFTYTRSTAPPPTPTVTLTNPADGAVFSAPASLKLGATASVSSGTVTNVQFFAGNTSLGSATTSPFKLTSSPLSAGLYALTAVATAAGVSATSAVANVSVINARAVNMSGAQVSGGQFSFSYASDPGLSYVIAKASNFSTGFAPVVTNVASNNPSLYTTPVSPSAGANFYRVGRLPNP